MNGNTTKVLIGLIIALVSAVWAITWGITRAETHDNANEIKEVKALQANQYAEIKGALGKIAGAVGAKLTWE